VFNDLAVASMWALASARVERVAIIDIDVHQGDGTASIFEDDSRVFTFSVHGANNFPFRKQRSTLDISLPDNSTAAEYFPALESGLEEVWRFEPQLVLFQSGVDGLSTDRLGRLSLTPEDLARRDHMVLATARAKWIPIVITMGGGYSEPIQITAEAHAQTYRTAAEIFAS
jgi:acetoin utilization deacetylase AcuC-like enzyme